MESNWNEPQVELPNSTLILILGIISILVCCCYGVLGLACSIITIVLAKTAADLYASNPQMYRESSYNNVTAGKICAWVGLIASVLYILFILYIALGIGFEALSDPEQIRNYLSV